MNPDDLGEVTIFGNALSHPLRIKILALVAAKGPLSPVEATKDHRLGPLGVVSYHFAQLVKWKCLKETRSRPVRGAVEHFYRITERGKKALRIAEEIAGEARKTEWEHRQKKRG